ncbi:MAG: glutathione S-transferase family protein [Paludibacterium sp.]|uniref:glutathione S-transferase family protein n=1 Tax=Paludibacterium sp. TaxID=1917523 RepID=UPI0025D0508D|nr:glutathione S-transferase family protein [Paludibacterium sp.]MBV8047410.1 glutathione S-transferase family protein [Paludibacterium sp.]MBV8649361.1 glutathione S-transferase family protein [Paludibacterium sp.]
MIKLYGSPLSPYCNKVKIALLEKGVNFEEVPAPASQTPEVLAKSPMGKIPYVEIGQFHLAESTAILEWLEDAYPTASLLPATPNGRARSRELMLMFDLYVGCGCVAFQRHKAFGAPLDQAARTEARALIVRGLAAVGRLARLGPYLVGDAFSYADLAAASVLPMVTLAGEILGENLLQPLAWAEDYLTLLAGRRTVALTWAAREQALLRLQDASSGQS